MSKKAETTEDLLAPHNLRARRERALILPTLSIKDIKEGESLFVQILSEIHGTEQKEKDGTVKLEDGKPLMLYSAEVVELTSGNMGNMVFPYMIKKGVEKIGDYVGKEFEFVKGTKKNRTNEWEVWLLG